MAVLLDTESFETDLGDWTQDATDDQDWTRHTGSTGSSGTGPSSAQDGSYYIYVEASSPNPMYTAGNEAIVEYDIGETTQGYVDFYVHLYGANMGTLYLEGWNGSTWTEIANWTGDTNSWQNKTTPETDFSGYSKLRFRDVAAGGFEGDMALDLIKIYQTDITINVSDSVTVTESWPGWSREPVGVSEDISASITGGGGPATLTINVSDNASVGESVGIKRSLAINISDSVAVSDTPLIDVTISILLSEAVTVAEAVDIRLLMSLNVTDSVSTSENILLDVSDPQISVSDAVTVTENVDIGDVPNVSVSDTITVTEYIAALGGFPDNPIVSDGVSVSESVQLIVSTPQIDVSDSISVSENVTVTVSDLEITTSDSVSVAEDVTASIPALINPQASDSVSISENVSVLIPELTIGVSDNVSVDENVEVYTPYLGVNVTDSISVSEDVDLFTLYNIYSSDSVTITESVGVFKHVRYKPGIGKVHKPRVRFKTDQPTGSVDARQSKMQNVMGKSPKSKKPSIDVGKAKK